MKYDVISVGSAAIDVFISSKDVEIERIHTHDDVCFPIGSKIIIDNLCSDIGGSAVNSSISFKRLGFRSACLAKIGDDLHGKIIQNHLKHEKVPFIGKKGRGQTGYSVVLTKLRGNRTILAYKGMNDKLKSSDINWNKLKTNWFYFGTMLNQSYQTLCKIARHAKKTNAKILFNPSKYLAEKGDEYLHPILKATDILILNKEEAQVLTGINASIKELLKELQSKIPLVVITNGAKGAHAYNGINVHSLVPKQVKICDPTGAGDAFASGFLSAIMLKQDIPTALKWGAGQANSVIQHFGAINKLLKRRELSKKSSRSGKTRKEVYNAS